MTYPQIKAVRCYGQGLQAISDGTNEVIVVPDTIDAEVAAISGFTGGLAIDFDNGYSLFVGDEDGYGPTKAWLTKDGENVTDFGWSTSAIVIPSFVPNLSGPHGNCSPVYCLVPGFSSTYHSGRAPV